VPSSSSSAHRRRDPATPTKKNRKTPSSEKLNGNGKSFYIDFEGVCVQAPPAPLKYVSSTPKTKKKTVSSRG